MRFIGKVAIKSKNRKELLYLAYIRIGFNSRTTLELIYHVLKFRNISIIVIKNTKESIKGIEIEFRVLME